MASIIRLLIYLSFLLTISEAANTRVQVTTPISPVTVGGVVAINCEVWNMQEEYNIKLFRVYGRQSEEITSGNTYMRSSSLWNRVFLSIRSYPGGSTVYFMTIVDVELDDKGKYLCAVYSVQDGLTELARDSIKLTVYSFPSKAYPECTSVPNRKSLNAGESLRLTCSSEKSHPFVELKWSGSTSSGHFVSHNISSENNVAFQVTVTAERLHHGTMFICTMRSPGFPERERSCSVGPIKVTGDINKNEAVVPTRAVGSINHVKSDVKDAILSEICNVECPEEDNNMIVYLAAGTMGATILMFTFLITTIILCCKYCKISGEVRAEQRSVPYDDGSEPVYVSLQRRPEPDRSSMYMSVEDPNNPGNKVLMPRELVEEFYRSLSLKRKK